MRRLTVFNQVSLDGYFVDRNGDMSWAKGGSDDEFDAFTEENARGGGVLLFGRVTYELMASFWPTKEAQQMIPVVAERMNSLPKVVFSRSLSRASWSNTTLVKGDLVAEIRRMKDTPGQDMVIMGSGTIASQLASTDLIDEYQIVLMPVVLGGGRTMFEGLDERLSMRLQSSRTFPSGKVFLRYEPVW